jgi:hypothetical protein
MLDGIVGNTDCCGIVAINGGWWLRVAHFFKCKLKDSGLFAMKEEGVKFGFGGGSNDEA